MTTTAWSSRESRSIPAPSAVIRRTIDGSYERPKEGTMESVLYDAAGHRRSPATMPGYHHGRPPRNKGMSYPADPPTIEEIVAVMRAAGDDRDGARLRALIVILWRAGLRIGEALDLAETDLDPDRGAVLVRKGKGSRRREVGMDRWAWQQLQPWLEIRARLPVGALLSVIHGPTAGRHWEQSAARRQLRAQPPPLAFGDGSRRISSDTPTRSRWRMRASRSWSSSGSQHANLGITSIYLQGIDSSEIIDTVHSRPAPVISATAGLRTGP
jgi:integrase